MALQHVLRQFAIRFSTKGFVTSVGKKNAYGDVSIGCSGLLQLAAETVQMTCNLLVTKLAKLDQKVDMVQLTCILLSIKFDACQRNAGNNTTRCNQHAPC